MKNVKNLFKYEISRKIFNLLTNYVKCRNRLADKICQMSQSASTQPCTYPARSFYVILNPILKVDLERIFEEKKD